MPTYNDHTVVMGFDYKEVVSGFKEMTNLLDSYKPNKGLLGGILSGNTEAIRQNSQQIDQTKTLNALEQRRLELKRRIHLADKLGLENLSGFVRVHQAEKDLSILTQKKIELNNLIADRQKVLQSAKNSGGEGFFNLSPARSRTLNEALKNEMIKRERLLGSNHKALAKVREGYEKLAASISKINSEKSLAAHREQVMIWKSHNTQITQAHTKMTGLARIQKGFNNSLRNMVQQYVSFFAIAGTGRSIVNTGKQFENVSAVMLQASGNAEQAGKDFAFVRAMASEMGMGLTETAQSYAKFAVAARSGGVSVEESNQMFRDFGITLRATGLTSDKAGLAFLALRQMLSGAVIQGQEMNQIIDQLPQVAAAANKAVKEMGFNVDSYKKAVETGTVESKQFARLIIKSMKDASVSTGAYAAMIESLTAAEGRFKLAMQESANEVFETGRLKQSLVIIMDGLAGLVKALTPAVTTLAFAFNAILTPIAGVTKGIDSAVKALGFDGGLASIVAFLVGPAGILLMASRITKLIGVLKGFAIVQRGINALKKQEIALDTFKTALTGPRGLAMIALAGAATYGVARHMNSTVNNINNDITVEAKGTTVEDAEAAVLNAAALGLGVPQ